MSQRLSFHHLDGTCGSCGIWRKLLWRRALCARQWRLLFHLLRVKKNYPSGKHHSDWCNRHRLAISQTSLERSPYLPTSPDIQPPWWIWLLAIYQFQPRWSSTYPDGSVKPFGGRVMRNVWLWVDVRLQMDGFLECQNKSRRKRLCYAETHFQVVSIHPVRGES